MYRKTKGIPPSKRKYNQNHPSLTIHVTREQFDMLEKTAVSNGMSVNQLIKESLGLVEKLHKKCEKEYEIGRWTGNFDFWVHFKCSKCGKPVQMKPDLNSDPWFKWIVDELYKKEYKHANCNNIQYDVPPLV